jgi:hypothetical protein
MSLLDAIAIGLVGLLVVNLAAAALVIAFSRPFNRAAAPHSSPAAELASHDGWPFVSIHLAAHDEPPALVIATLAALARLDYPAFEVIVIDNNTPDPHTWQPVERAARALGPAVRFVHREGVVGAKAGALNIALEMTDPRAEFIAVVDADYMVRPDFLRRAMGAFGPETAFVQFPQAYRHADGAGAVIAELSDYFQTFPRAANRTHATLLTGTLSVIRADALRGVKGWPTGSITEDAELGVRLWGTGATGLFVAEDIGRGLLPLDLAGLRLQRQRWVRGNIQTLIGASRMLRRGGKGTLEVIAQLTAWTGFCALPLAGLVLSALVRLADAAPTAAWRMVEGVAVATLLAVLVTHLVRALVRQRPASIAVTLALFWTSSFGWLAALSGRRLRFRRTPKRAGEARAGTWLSADTLGSLAALAAAGVFAYHGAGLTAATLAIAASGLATAPLVDRWLRRAARAAADTDTDTRADAPCVA